jgi:hypothetical protein
LCFVVVAVRCIVLDLLVSVVFLRPLCCPMNVFRNHRFGLAAVVCPLLRALLLCGPVRRPLSTVVLYARAT